ncbi:hypothetical protein HYW75_02705 [Candidatus Pacearchaeota archaeon]|nr:hypothetical protein [Candidatus Pacearchaeota archaeon]
MVETITDKIAIEKIINEKIKGKNLIFTRYYRLSIAQKGLTHEKVWEVFPQFERIMAIEKEIMRGGDEGYEIFYNLSKDTSFSIATIPKDNKVLIIHAVEYKRDLNYRFKQK